MRAWRTETGKQRRRKSCQGVWVVSNWGSAQLQNAFVNVTSEIPPLGARKLKYLSSDLDSS